MIGYSVTALLVREAKGVGPHFSHTYDRRRPTGLGADKSAAAAVAPVQRFRRLSKTEARASRLTERLLYHDQMRMETVDFVSVPTRDRARAIAWYRDVLGLRVSAHKPGEVEALGPPCHFEHRRSRREVPS